MGKKKTPKTETKAPEAKTGGFEMPEPLKKIASDLKSYGPLMPFTLRNSILMAGAVASVTFVAPEIVQVVTGVSDTEEEAHKIKKTKQALGNPSRKCPACGDKIDANVSYCRSCGHHFFCSGCGACQDKNPQVTCESCGESLHSDDAHEMTDDLGIYYLCDLCYANTQEQTPENPVKWKGKRKGVAPGTQHYHKKKKIGHGHAHPRTYSHHNPPCPNCKCILEDVNSNPPGAMKCPMCGKTFMENPKDIDRKWTT